MRDDDNGRFPSDRAVGRRALLGALGTAACGLVPGVTVARPPSIPSNDDRGRQPDRGRGPDRDRRRGREHDREVGSNGGGVIVTPATAMDRAAVEREYDRLGARYGRGVARRTFPEWAAAHDSGIGDEKRGRSPGGSASGSNGGGGEREGTEPGRTTETATTGDTSTTAASNGDDRLKNVVRVDLWDHHYDVRSRTGLLLARTDHYLTLYEVDERDPSGRRIYLWKALDYSEARDGWWYSATTDYMDSRLDCRTDALDLVQFRPERRIEFGNGDERLELSVGPATVESVLGGSSGYEGPDPSRIEYGLGGQYAYEVGGRIGGLTTGSMLVDTRTDGEYEFYWETSVRASSGY